eukprot:TRINITY_DN5386_c0_g1_i1.p1 TRINITY_DN5386_c0_g1~~TRINITY_DN5386_c0_g1_i1.p1  ORF type:complete len:1212 (-),score=343.69 TRINITY_DN5386_c0_g1_i1:95-3730(-)
MLRARQQFASTFPSSSSSSSLKCQIRKPITNNGKKNNDTGTNLEEKNLNQRRGLVNDTSTWYKKFKWLMLRKNRAPTPPKLLPVTERTPGQRISVGLKSNREFRGFRIPYVFPYLPSFVKPFKQRMDPIEARRILGISEKAELTLELFEEHIKWATFNNHPDLGGSSVIPKQLDLALNVLKPIIEGEEKPGAIKHTYIDDLEENEETKTQFDPLELMDVNPENRDQWTLERIRRREYYYRKNENVLGGDSRGILLRHFKPESLYTDIDRPLFPKRDQFQILGNPNVVRNHFATMENYDPEIRKLASEDNDRHPIDIPKDYLMKHDVITIHKGIFPPFQTDEFADFFNKPKPGKSPEVTPDGKPFYRKPSEKDSNAWKWEEAQRVKANNLKSDQLLREAIEESFFAKAIDSETGEEIIDVDPEAERKAKEELEDEERFDKYFEPHSKLDFVLSDDEDIEEAKAKGLAVTTLPPDLGKGETNWNRDDSGMYVFKRRGYRSPVHHQDITRHTQLYRDEIPDEMRRLHPFDRARAIMALKKIPGSFLAHTTPRWGNPFMGLETEYFGLDRIDNQHYGLPREDQLYYDELGDPLEQVMVLDWHNAYLVKHMEDAIDDESLEYWQPYINLIEKAYNNQVLAIDIASKLCLLPTEKMTMQEILEIVKPAIRANQPDMVQYEDHELITDIDVTTLGQGRPLLNIQDFETDEEAKWLGLKEWLEEKGLWDEKFEEPELAAHRKKMDIEWIARQDQYVWERKSISEEVLIRRTFNEMQKAYEDMIPLRTKLFKAAFYRKLQTASEMHFPLTNEERKMLTPQIQKKLDYEYQKWIQNETQITEDYDSFEKAFQKLRHDLDRLHRFIVINTGDLDYHDEIEEDSITKKQAKAMEKRAERKKERQQGMTLAEVRAEELAEKEKDLKNWDIEEKEIPEDVFLDENLLNDDPYYLTPEEEKEVDEIALEEIKTRDKEIAESDEKFTEPTKREGPILYEDDYFDEKIPEEVLPFKKDEDPEEKIENYRLKKEKEKIKKAKELREKGLADPGEPIRHRKLPIVGEEWWKKGVEDFDDSPNSWKGPYRYGYVPRKGPDPTISGTVVVDHNFRLLPKDAVDDDSRMQLLALKKADFLESKRIAAEEAEGIIREWKSDLSPFSKTNAEELLLRHGHYDFGRQLKQLSSEISNKGSIRRDVKKVIESAKSKFDHLKEGRIKLDQRKSQERKQ